MLPAQSERFGDAPLGDRRQSQHGENLHVSRQPTDQRRINFGHMHSHNRRRCLDFSPMQPLQAFAKLGDAHPKWLRPRGCVPERRSDTRSAQYAEANPDGLLEEKA